MPVFPVESLDDPRIEIYRNLRSTNRTRDLGMMVAESDRVVRRMIEKVEREIQHLQQELQHD